MKAKKKKYAYPLKLDERLKKPLQEMATANRRKINDEINIAVEKHVNNGQGS
jgi:hypothetical protein